MKPTAEPYHHKDLRESLLQAAVQLIGEVGPSNFTLREVARRAGVSHNAPYRHFRDRNQILAAVAEQGFEELTETMASAAEQPSGAFEQLKAYGLAYVGFALRRPDHFTAMFEASIEDCDREQMGKAGDAAFALLLTLVEGCQSEGLMLQGDVHQIALVNWSMVHGIAKLAIAGRLPFESTNATLEFVRFVLDRCLLDGASVPVTRKRTPRR